jgi:predicted NUDIX family phosphoesterase
MDELVFAVPTQTLWDIFPYIKTGFISPHDDRLNQVVEHGIFHKRDELEHDPSYKQLIPYGIISHNQAYFLFQRSPGQREKRLHHNLHLGVGGHMNPWDEGKPPDGRETPLQKESPVREGSSEAYVLHELKREMLEEVDLIDDCTIEHIDFKGFINDESIQVGRMHLGLLYDIRVSARGVVVRETDKMTGRWISKQTLLSSYKTLETWSRIAVEAYIV